MLRNDTKIDGLANISSLLRNLTKSAVWQHRPKSRLTLHLARSATFWLRQWRRFQVNAFEELEPIAAAYGTDEEVSAIYAYVYVERRPLPEGFDEFFDTRRIGAGLTVNA